MTTMTTAGDAQIKAALVADFDRGFSELVRVHQAGIYSGVRRLTRRPEDAQDVAQDTFVRAYSALATYDEDRIKDLRVRPWLWTIALNLCRNRARSKVAESSLMDHDAHVESDGGGIDDVAWNRRLSALNNHQRTAVVMRYVLDLPISEIAEATCRPEGTVKADVSRALTRLRTTIEAEVLNAN